ncbi:hypothetical protein DFH06DRAFT_535306 [Mycena polygramma]|nr:hypothetical protein DFH06DRAFT_535306 [Mycena polygramma]
MPSPRVFSASTTRRKTLGSPWRNLPRPSETVRRAKVKESDSDPASHAAQKCTSMAMGADARASTDSASAVPARTPAFVTARTSPSGSTAAHTSRDGTPRSSNASTPASASISPFTMLNGDDADGDDTEVEGDHHDTEAESNGNTEVEGDEDTEGDDHDDAEVVKSDETEAGDWDGEEDGDMTPRSCTPAPAALGLGLVLGSTPTRRAQSLWCTWRISRRGASLPLRASRLNGPAPAVESRYAQGEAQTRTQTRASTSAGKLVAERGRRACIPHLVSLFRY